MRLNPQKLPHFISIKMTPTTHMTKAHHWYFDLPEDRGGGSISIFCLKGAVFFFFPLAIRDPQENRSHEKRCDYIQADDACQRKRPSCSTGLVICPYVEHAGPAGTFIPSCTLMPSAPMERGKVILPCLSNFPNHSNDLTINRFLWRFAPGAPRHPCSRTCDPSALQGSGTDGRGQH